MPSRAFRLGLTALGLVTFVGIGGLQMANINAGLITSYGADILAPAFLYLAGRAGYWLRLLTWGRRPTRTVALLVVGGGSVLWEWSQRYDWSSTLLAIAAGTFDPWDLVAYTVGLVTAVLVENRWRHHLGLPPPPQAVTLSADRSGRAA